MRIVKAVALFFSAALFCAVLSPRTNADDWNKKTLVTFSESVQIPGQILTPGTYIFQLMDSQANRNLVQVWSADHRFLFATLQTNADYHWPPTLRPIYAPDQPQFELDERPAGQPMALRSWFVPGQLTGFEFIYPSAH